MRNAEDPCQVQVKRSFWAGGRGLRNRVYIYIGIRRFFECPGLRIMPSGAQKGTLAHSVNHNVFYGEGKCEKGSHYTTALRLTLGIRTTISLRKMRLILLLHGLRRDGKFLKTLALV